MKAKHQKISLHIIMVLRLSPIPLSYQVMALGYCLLMIFKLLMADKQQRH